MTHPDRDAQPTTTPPLPRGAWKLAAAGEPFRLLFPLGVQLGVLGVAMWPLYIWNITSLYPGISHPRIMIQGFLTSFIAGFLGTAFPRMLEVPKFSMEETLGFCVALICITWLHFTGSSMLGDLVFCLTLSALVFCLCARAFSRRDTPPPGFTLVALGLLSAVAGSGMQALHQSAPALLPPVAVALSRLLLHQGYILLPIMGIGAFLLPRFFGLPSRQSFPESLALPPGWLKGAAFALVCGLAVIASFILEALDQLRAGYGLRAAAVFIYFFREVPVHRASFAGGTLAVGLRVALASIPLGYLLIAIWPVYASSFLHIVFITGFSLITLVVASRVVLGHSGRSHLFRASLPPVLFMAALLTLAMLTRVSADWMPNIRMTHYAYAALAWMAGACIWAAGVLPGVRLPDAEADDS